MSADSKLLFHISVNYLYYLNIIFPMYLNDKIQQFRDYFSSDRFDKVKKTLSDPYDPMTQTGIVAIIGCIMLFVVTPWYVGREYDRRIGQPLREIQQEYFRREEIRMQREGELKLNVIKMHSERRELSDSEKDTCSYNPPLEKER